MNEEHIVAVFPHQEEGHTGGTHGEIAKHLQGKTVLEASGGGITVMIYSRGFNGRQTSVPELMLLLRNPVKAATWQEK